MATKTKEEKEQKLPPFHNIANEQAILAYLMRNPSRSSEYQVEHFLHPLTKAIFRGIVRLYHQKINFDLDSLVICCKEEGKKIEYATLRDIYDGYENFDNINFFKVTLENDYLKHHINTNVLEDILTESTQKDFLRFEKIKVFAEDLLLKVSHIGSQVNLLTTEDLMNKHVQLIDLRDKGVTQRSLGFRILDEKCTRPAAPGEVTITFGMKGFGKSAFVKSIENNLINKGVCVVSFNLEMTEESTVDRLLCMRENLDLKAIQQPNMGPRLKARVLDGLRRLAELKNYLYCPEETFNMDMLNAYIYKAKDHFRRAGVLPEDEYMVITIDLLEMMTDFGKKTPEDITEAMDKLHRIVKRHKVHVIGVVQANENKLRAGGKMFKNPEELNYYKLGLSDIYGGSAYAARARVVISLHRPVFMKRQFFPEQEEIWKLEPDVLNVHVIKQNDGDLAFMQLLYGDNFRITAYSGAQS